MKKNSKNNYCFPSEFTAACHDAGFSAIAAAKICSRDLRTIKNWEAGRTHVPAWALRLIVLESRYMEALYGLQATDAGRAGFALGRNRTTTPANDTTALPIAPVTRKAL